MSEKRGLSESVGGFADQRIVCASDLATSLENADFRLERGILCPDLGKFRKILFCPFLIFLKKGTFNQDFKK